MSTHSGPTRRPHNYLVDESALGWFYKTVFPLDAFYRPKVGPDDKVFALQKKYELFPIMLFLLPFIVMVTGFYYSLTFMGTLFLYAVQAILLAVVSQYYIKAKGGTVFELAVQYFCALCLWSLMLLVLTWMVGCMANTDNWGED